MLAASYAVNAMAVAMLIFVAGAILIGAIIGWIRGVFPPSRRDRQK